MMSVKNFGYQSGWCTRDKKEELLFRLHPGDLIEFRRDGYHHWAVYAGGRFDDPKVLHAGSAAHFHSCNVFFGSKSLQKRRHRVGAVCVDSLHHVWMESEARINNEVDKEHPPYDPSVILNRGRQEIKNQTEYNAITNNCEHFATWCRNGVRISKQTQEYLTTGLTIVGTAAGMILVLAIIMMQKSSAEEEKSKKSRRKMSIPLD